MFHLVVLIVGFSAVSFGTPVAPAGAQIEGAVAVGGRPATTGEFPYHASLRESQTPNTHFCSGAIINNRWILTSAVCTSFRSNTAIIARIGTIFTNAGGITHTSSQVLTHHLYNLNRFFYELGLVQTAAVMTFTSTVQFIALASVFTGPGIGVTSVGFGPRTQMHVMSATTLTNADCASRMTDNWHQFIYPHTLCILGATGNAVCENGNPLVANSLLVGVAAWDLSCSGTHPAMHERVAYFREWILTTAT